MKKRIIFLMVVAAGLLASCKSSTGPGDECDDNGPPCPPDGIDMISLKAPSADQIYWDDEALPCAASVSGFAGEKPEWSINGETVSCVDGELATTPPFGEHNVAVAIGSGSDRKEQSVTITVKEGFSVSLSKPKSGTEFFVVDKVVCEASITPEKYEEYLQITVSGAGNCTNGEAEFTDAGESTVRAFASVDGRTEADEAVVQVKPVVSGKIYPLTDRGVAFASGFEFTLKAGGETHNAQTDADGEFSIKSDRFAELSGHEVTLTVAESSDFYGAKAILTAEELKALIEDGRLGFILAPRRWQIRCGPFSGQSTTIKLPEAFKRYDRERQYSSFYMLFKIIDKRFYRKLLPRDRPLLTAFDREESTVSITAADSTTFWKETEAVEEKICRGDLFAPATISEVPTNRDGVLISAVGADDPSSGAAGPDENGHIKGGSMSLSIDDFGNSDTQAHELNQVLGFGETSEWAGIMASNGGFSNATRYSTDDIAHIQAYIDAVDLQSEEDVSFGIYAWRRVLNIPSLPDN